MKKNNKIISKLVTIYTIVALVFNPVQSIFSEGTVPVEDGENTDGQAVLNPGYIAGTVSTGITNINRVYLKARSTDFETYLYKYNSEGEYKLTVNVPENQTITYDMFQKVSSYNYQYYYSHIVSDSNKDVMIFKPVSIDVNEGQTSVVNYIIDSGFIYGKISFNYDNVTIVEGNSSKIYASIDDGVNFSYAYTKVSSDGTFSFPIQPNENIKVHGSVVLSNGETCKLEEKTINVYPKLETEVNWYIELTGCTYGKIDHNININSSDVQNYHYVHLYAPSGSLYKTQKHDGYYLFENLVPGSWKLRPYSYLNNGDDMVYHSKGSFPYPVTVTAGETVDCDVEMNPVYVKGKIQLSGTKSIEDVKTTTIYADGIYNTDSYLGMSSDRANSDGTFDLMVHPGSWNIYRSNYYFYTAEPYLQCQMYVYDYALRNSKVHQAVEGGEINDLNFHYATGSATIKFSRTDGGEFTNPYVRAICRNYDENNKQINYIYAYGYGYKAGEKQATFVGLPGTYEVDTYARVDSAVTEFGKVIVTIEAGTEKVIDIDGPKLSIKEPEADLYTNSSSISVNGVATDDIKVSQVTINGVESLLQSTENPDDSREVSFNQKVTLNEGKNSIETIAIDSSNKTSSDKRNVYYDPNAPVLTWKPDDGSSFDVNEVKLEGKGTDETGIIELYLNGEALTFSKTNNPDDENEITYSSTIKLNAGSNSITLKAVDKCGNVKEEVHKVTYNVAQDTTPPSIKAPNNIVVEQASYKGNVVDLGKPQVSDNVDTNLTVTNNAPEIFPQGVTVVTWTVTDSSNNKNTATQSVTVRDTTPPVISAPKKVKVTQNCDNGAKISLETLKVTDKADPNPKLTNNAPCVFKIGKTIVTWVAKDKSGNTSKAYQEVEVVKEEQAKPIDYSLKVSDSYLWPPNHKYHTINVDIIADEDIKHLIKLVSVTSDELEDAKLGNENGNKGDGNTLNDIIIVNNNTVKLRAERLGGSDGRVYTFNYEAIDSSLNVVKRSVQVYVPHDMGKKTAVFSGVKYVVTSQTKVKDDPEDNKGKDCSCLCHQGKKCYADKVDSKGCEEKDDQKECDDAKKKQIKESLIKCFEEKINDLMKKNECLIKEKIKIIENINISKKQICKFAKLIKNSQKKVVSYKNKIKRCNNRIRKYKKNKKQVRRYSKQIKSCRRQLKGFRRKVNKYTKCISQTNCKLKELSQNLKKVESNISQNKSDIIESLKEKLSCL